MILGGGAPAVKTYTFCFNFFLSFSGAPVIIFKTIGAPPKCVTLYLSINSKIFLTSIFLKQIVRPINIGTVHG